MLRQLMLTCIVLMMVLPSGFAKDKEIWFCPMHPDFVRDHQGQCGICGMDLILKKADGKQSESLSLTDKQQQLIGIKLAKAIEAPVTKRIRVPGYIMHDTELYEAQLTYINAWREYYAFRSHRPIDKELTQDWREYYVKPSGRPKSADFRDAQFKLIKAQQELEHMGITAKQLEQLRYIKFGQPWVDPQLLFFKDGQMLWVYADVNESDLGYLAPGQEVDIKVRSMEMVEKGIVRSIAQAVDPVTRKVRVRIEMPYLKIPLATNMLVDVVIRSQLDKAIQVPQDAVIDAGDYQLVYKVKNGNEFTPTKVVVRDRIDGMAVIEKGLSSQDTVVASGNFLLDAESKLQAVGF